MWDIIGYLASIIGLITGSWFVYEKYNKNQRIKKRRCPNNGAVEVKLEEIPEGEVPLNSAFYIERPPIEQDCYTAIEQANSLIRVKAPRQMGKSSLIARILHHAQETQSVNLVELNFQLLDAAIIGDLDKLLQWFAGCVAKQTGVTFNPEEHWDSRLFGSKMCCQDYFEKYILPNMDTQFLIISLEEVDRIFQHQIVAKDFLGMIRAWHEAGKNKPLWQKLQFVLAHSQEVYIQLDINESPFNVGLPIQLDLFSFEQSKDLMLRHGLTWSDDELRELRKWVGGHPYLLRLGFYAVAKQRLSLQQLCQTITSSNGIYIEHLRRHLHHLKHAGLDKDMKQIVRTQHPIVVDTDIGFKLHSLGLIYFTDNNEVKPRFELYRQYFKNTL